MKRERSVADPTILTASVVSAYVANNVVPVPELAAVLRGVHAALSGLRQPTASPAALELRIARPSPKRIEQSLTPDAIVSFIDGKPYKTLARHLKQHGLDPRAYRRLYGLPVDYPTVAPAYARRRSDIAKAMGLGRLGRIAQRATRAAQHRMSARAASQPRAVEADERGGPDDAAAADAARHWA